MRANELIFLRPAEVRAAAEAANSMGALCETLGASYLTVRRALNHLGIERRWRRGRYKDSDPKLVERNATIVAQREQDSPLSFRQIGVRHRISAERVRQILNACGRSDLCGAVGKKITQQRRKDRLVEWACVNCGRKEKRPPRQAGAKTCSRKCFGENKRFPLEETTLVFGPHILELREAGKKWREIGEILNLKGSSPTIRGATASSILHAWAKRVGADISHLRTGRANARPAPPSHEICRRYTENLEPATRLSKEYGIACGRVIAILKSNNIPIRGRADAQHARFAGRPAP